MRLRWPPTVVGHTIKLAVADRSGILPIDTTCRLRRDTMLDWVIDHPTLNAYMRRDKHQSKENDIFTIERAPYITGHDRNSLSPGRHDV